MKKVNKDHFSICNMTQKEKINEFYKWLKETMIYRRNNWFRSEEENDVEMKDILKAEYLAHDEILTNFVQMQLAPYENIKLQLGLRYECLETSYYCDSRDEMFTKGRTYVVTKQNGYEGLPSNDGFVRLYDCGVLTTEYFKPLE